MKRPLFLPAAVLCLVIAAITALFTAWPSSADQGSANNDFLVSPVRIAAMADGPLLVTDYVTGSVCKMNRNTLRVLRCFAVEGRPLGMAWSQGRIYVGDETTGTVVAYNPGGKQLFTFGGNGSLKAPGDMVIDEQHGSLFVVDTADRNIKVFDLEGGQLSTITGDAAGNGKLVNPVAIAVDPVRGEVLVSDFGDPSTSYPARIRIYDYAGNFVLALSGRTGGFSRPQGLNVARDRIFVADAMLGQVLVFDRTTLAKVKTLGTFGEGPGRLMLPLDVLVDPASGDVFVTNNRMGRVERFEKGGLVP